MGLLQTYDPPARMSDFDSIRGQREAWHDFVLKGFQVSIQIERQKLEKQNGGKPVTPQIYSAALYDPGGPLVEQAVVWNAFPKELLRRYGRDRALVEADRLWPLSAYDYDWRYDPAVPADTGIELPNNQIPTDSYFYRPTVEYCEWHVDREPHSGRVRRVTFTSEPPEYWQAMFGGAVYFDTVNKTHFVNFPGDQKLLLDLYRKLVDPNIALPDLLVDEPFISPFGPPPSGQLKKGDYNPHNKWNTTHGIVHLSAPPNALIAEIMLAADATILYEDRWGNPVVDPDALISGADIGGPNRNSDPTISATVNALARAGAMITLANPVGLYMDHIDLAGWEVPGGIAATDCVRVVRGQDRLIERLVVEVPTDEFDISDIRIGGFPVIFGGQIAECITVKLIGVAAALGSAHIGPIKLPDVGYVDPANAREIFAGGRRGVPVGTVPAFLYESGEVAKEVSRVRRRPKFAARAAR